MPQCIAINAMPLDVECHDVCFVGRKISLMILTHWPWGDVAAISKV